jgi:hypothetical protein
MEFAWKSHIGLLYPTPSQFTSFLGDVSVWQGVVTGGLMVGALWGIGSEDSRHDDLHLSTAVLRRTPVLKLLNDSNALLPLSQLLGMWHGWRLMTTRLLIPFCCSLKEHLYNIPKVLKQCYASVSVPQVLSPAMFERMGWKGVAGATPLLLLWGGLFFFAACITYQFAFAGG